MDAEPYEKLLEEKFLTYAELSKVIVKENCEPMVRIGPECGVGVFCFDVRMRQYTGSDIYVRKSVAQKLKNAQAVLETLMPSSKLEVVYGYRHLDIQRTTFDDIRKKLINEAPSLDENAINERVHFFIAVPEVAGHPTGGAVDIRILCNGEKVDMGTEAHDFAKSSYVHHPIISKIAWHNRQILRTCMTTVGFAPFDAEWWHFSYGDREWAKYYNQPYAVYDQISFQAGNNNPK
jgi:zinc D-Ala-D-Ala dipeptidase